MSQQANGLRGQTTLVTGAAKRLGRATALALVDEGANVVVHYRTSQDEAEATATELRARGVDAWIVAADLRDPSEAQQLVPRAVEVAGPIDALINSASIFDPSTLMDFTVEQLADNVQVNAMAPLQLARAFVAQGRDGSIVNLLDTRIAEYDSKHVAYHLSKRMFADLTRMMALEFAPKVRVNAVAPGLVLPPAGEDESYMQRLASSNPLQRAGRPDGVTDAIRFLLKSDFVTGQTIYVDGGYHMKGRVYD